MDPMTLSVLAQAASSALVASAVTEAWGDVRHKLARWFGRGKPDPGALRALDQTHDELAAVAPDHLSELQEELARDWVVRFKDLARNQPGAASELDALVREIQGLLPARPVTAGDHSVAAGRDVTISADGGSTAIGVLHGNIAPPGPTKPGPAS